MAGPKRLIKRTKRSTIIRCMVGPTVLTERWKSSAIIRQKLSKWQAGSPLILLLFLDIDLNGVFSWHMVNRRMIPRPTHSIKSRWGP